MYFGVDGSENYLIFQPIHKCFTTPIDGNGILASKSKVLLEGSFKPPDVSDNSLASKLIFI